MTLAATQSEFLSPDEVRELTGYARASEQRRALTGQGIPFKEMGRRTIVLRRHVVAWLEGRDVSHEATPSPPPTPTRLPAGLIAYQQHCCGAWLGRTHDLRPNQKRTANALGL